jgi:hypothetical protein
VGEKKSEERSCPWQKKIEAGYEVWLYEDVSWNKSINHPRKERGRR